MTAARRGPPRKIQGHERGVSLKLVRIASVHHDRHARGDASRRELTEIPPTVGMVRQFSVGNEDIYVIQTDGNPGLHDSDGLIRVAQKIE